MIPAIGQRATINLRREPGNKATCSCTHSVHVHYSYMYLALIYQARICTCISICNLVCMSTNNVLRSCSSYHKQLININEEISVHAKSTHDY